MKKYGFIIFVMIQIFLSFWTIAYFSQNSYASSNHPYRFFSERRISQFDQFPVTSEAIVFLGDSLVDEGRWEEIFPGQKIFNRGVLADRTEHVLARLDQITQGQPKMIFIMVGTNDLKSGIRQKTIISNYHKILNMIRKQSPKTKVFVQSLLPRKVKFKKQIEQINNELVLLAQKSGYTYIDLYSVFLGRDGSIKKEYSNDDLHLLGAGYLKWKEIILPYINLGK